MTNNVIVKKTKIQGKSGFANMDFRPGDVILEIDDSHVVKDSDKLTKRQYAFDLDYLENGKVVHMQAPEKRINHSCHPNAYTKTARGIRKAYAMRDITKGDEITFDYAINGHNDGTFACHCKSKKCRKIYQGNFFKLPKAIQRKYLPYLEDWFKKQFRKEIKGLTF